MDDYAGEFSLATVERHPAGTVVQDAVSARPPSRLALGFCDHHQVRPDAWGRGRLENHHDPVYRRYDEAWAIQFERVFQQLRLPGDAWEAAHYFRSKLADAPAFEEARPFIEALRTHYTVAMLSNADDDFLHQCLDRNNLHFDVVVSSEQARAIKPNREIFDRLATELQTPHAQILYAGDNPVPDVLGPKQAGMLAAWVNRGGFRKPRKVPYPDVRVRSLSELLPLLVPALD